MTTKSTSSSYLSTAESFIIIAADSSSYIPSILSHLRQHNLKIEHQRTLYLNEILSERLLRAILLDSSSSSSSSSSLSNTVSNQGSSSSRPSSAQHHPSSSSSSVPEIPTQRRFGSTVMGASNISGTLSRQYAPVRPTVDECETFSILSGPATVITISCVDPRVDVVNRVANLVGMTNSNTLLSPSSTMGLQRQYPSRSGIIEILAPSVPSQAVKALHLLEEYYIRQEAHHPSTIATTTNSEAISTANIIPPTLGKSYLVDMDILYDFLFPPQHQHSMSTGRLILFALYGPLNADGKITGGLHHSRTLTESEIETMVKELEQDDMLAVYTSGSVKGDIKEVLIDVQAASRGYPRMTRTQIEQMIADLPRDSRGRCSFHDIQKRVLGSRLQRIEDMRKMFPNITRETDELLTATRIQPPPKAFGRGKLLNS